MKKQLLLLVIAGISLLFIAADVCDIYSAGAPIASTGAPGESTCAKSGCHTGSNVNSGTGILDIDFNYGITTYEPGKTYTLTIILNQQNISRFGFEMLALKQSDSTNAGTFNILDTIRTQILEGANQYLGRKYVTYRYPGTAPYESNMGKWFFEWTAPSSSQGTILLYVAAVSANNDGTDKGDLVYTKKLTVKVTPNGIKEETAMNLVRVFPNPSNGKLDVRSSVGEVPRLEFYNSNGEKLDPSVIHYSQNNLSVATSTITLDVPDGVYFLLCHNGNSAVSEKLIIKH